MSDSSKRAGGPSAAVTHDRDHHRFVLSLPDGGPEAILEYLPRPDGQGPYRLVHTEVPDGAQGQGFGTRLVAGALDQIAAEGGQIVAHCPFVVDFLERQPDYARLEARR